MLLGFDGQRSFRAMLGHMMVNSVYERDDQAIRRLEDNSSIINSTWIDTFQMMDRLLFCLRFTAVKTRGQQQLRVPDLPHSEGKSVVLNRLGIDSSGETGVSLSERNHYVAVIAYIVSAVMSRWLGASSNLSYASKYLAMSMPFSTISGSPESADHLVVLNQFLANDKILQSANYWQSTHLGVKANAMTYLLNSLHPFQRIRPARVMHFRDVSQHDLNPDSDDYAQVNHQLYIAAEVEQDLSDNEAVECQFDVNEATTLTSGKRIYELAVSPSFTQVLEEIDTRFFTIAFMMYKETVEAKGQYDAEVKRLSFADRIDFKRITNTINNLFTRLIDDKIFQAQVIQFYIDHFEGDVRRAYANIIPQLMFHAGQSIENAHQPCRVMVKAGTLKTATQQLIRYSRSMTMDFSSQVLQREIMSMVEECVPSFTGAQLSEFFNFERSTPETSCRWQAETATVGSYFSNFGRTLRKMGASVASSATHMVTRKTYYGYCLPDGLLNVPEVADITMDTIATDLFRGAAPVDEIVATAGPDMTF